MYHNFRKLFGKDCEWLKDGREEETSIMCVSPILTRGVKSEIGEETGEESGYLTSNQEDELDLEDEPDDMNTHVEEMHPNTRGTKRKSSGSSGTCSGY